MGQRMKKPLPLYCYRFQDRHGKWRVRFNDRKHSTYLKSPIGSPEFKEEYRAALTHDKVTSKKVNKAGSMAVLIELYYKSPEYVVLADITKDNYRGILEKFRAEHGDKRASLLKRQHVKEIKAKLVATKTRANRLISVLAMVLDIAVDLEWIQSNPARGIKPFKIKTQGWYSWTDNDIETFETAYKSGSKERLAFALLFYTLCRRSDVVKMGRQHISGGRIKYTQQKTGAVVDVRIHAALQKEINLISHDHLTFLLTALDRPFTVYTYADWFKTACEKAGLPKCSSHGLRKAGARRMAEAGMTPHQIQAVTGHRTLKEVQLYADDANRLTLGDIGIGGLTKKKSK